MYLTGIIQLGVAKSVSAALLQNHLKNRLIIVINIYFKLFSKKKVGERSPIPQKKCSP
jgi:hypothetical protein